MREDRTAAMGLGELRGEKQRLPSRRRAAMAIAAAGDRWSRNEETLGDWEIGDRKMGVDL